MSRLVLSSCLLITAAMSQVDISWARTASKSIDPVEQKAETASHIPVKLPVRLYGGYLLVAEGAIGNAHKLNFLVDTGACPSVIDQKIAHDLKLAEQPERVNLWNKSVQVRRVVIPSLSLGPVRVESIPVLAEDLSFLQKALGFKVHAIIGLDVLRKSSFTINYQTKEILFGSPDSLAYSVAFETDTPVVTVRMRFHNRWLRMVVDSGGPDLTLFRSRVSEATGLQTVGTETVADAGGTFQRTKVNISEAYIGNVKIAARTAFLVDDRKDEGDDFDGVLGVTGLQFSKVAFDFENRRLSWEMPTVDSTITVEIYDDVQLPQRVLADARYEATRVYQKAGVAVSLIECKSSNSHIEANARCQDSDSANHLKLRIVHAGKSSDGVFGIAFLSEEGTGAYGDVFYDSAELMDRDWHIGLARILGHVMAHELGHLLLGSNAHSQLGIMRPRWHGDELDLATRGALLFSQDQARLMRERLARHTSDSIRTQRMVCNTGYKVQECSQQLSVLRETLARYHADRMGAWTWVLVKSDDWKRIVRGVQGNTDSPAFTVLEMRETFLEEALFVPLAGRSADLLRVWSVPLDKFLSLAVTHELGHAMCNEPDEARADRFGLLLRQGNEAKCFGAISDAGSQYHVQSKSPAKMN